jgi:hypothetical protein
MSSGGVVDGVEFFDALDLFLSESSDDVLTFVVRTDVEFRSLDEAQKIECCQQ